MCPRFTPRFTLEDGSGKSMCPRFGSEQGGRACTIATSLIETAKAHGLDPQAYLTDILTRLPTTLNKDIDQLLPMNWTPTAPTG